MKPFQFLKEVGQQTKQISWPNKKNVLKLSITVIVISMFSAITLGSFDLLFANAFAKINQIKQPSEQIQNLLQNQPIPENIATDSATPIPTK